MKVPIMTELEPIVIRGPGRPVLAEVLVGDLHEAVRLDRIDGRHGNGLLVNGFRRIPLITTVQFLLALYVLDELRKRLLLREASALAFPTVLFDLPRQVVTIYDDLLELWPWNVAQLGVFIDEADQLDSIRHECVLVLHCLSGGARGRVFRVQVHLRGFRFDLPRVRAATALH